MAPPAAPNAAPTKDEKVQAMSDDVKKRLTSLQSGKDVEDLRFQPRGPRVWGEGQTVGHYP